MTLHCGKKAKLTIDGHCRHKCDAFDECIFHWNWRELSKRWFPPPCAGHCQHLTPQNIRNFSSISISCKQHFYYNLILVVEYNKLNCWPTSWEYKGSIAFWKLTFSIVNVQLYEHMGFCCYYLYSIAEPEMPARHSDAHSLPQRVWCRTPSVWIKSESKCVSLCFCATREKWQSSIYLECPQFSQETLVWGSLEQHWLVHLVQPWFTGFYCLEFIGICI